MADRCLAEFCANWTGQGCICEVLDLDPVDAREPEDLLDPCGYCPHDNTEHAEDGCRLCPCAVPQ